HLPELEHRRRRQRLHADRRVRGGRSRGREPVLQHHGAVMRSSELDARRELAREFHIEGLLQRPPGPIVYLARDAEERPLALKVAPRVDGGPEDRFHAAADAAGQLADPHIVPVYRHGATENFVWYAAKHVDGRSLATMLQTSGPLELAACRGRRWVTISQPGRTASPDSPCTSRRRCAAQFRAGRPTGFPVCSTSSRPSGARGRTRGRRGPARIRGRRDRERRSCSWTPTGI